MHANELPALALPPLAATTVRWHSGSHASSNLDYRRFSWELEEQAIAHVLMNLALFLILPAVGFGVACHLAGQPRT